MCEQDLHERMGLFAVPSSRFFEIRVTCFGFREHPFVVWSFGLRVIIGAGERAACSALRVSGSRTASTPNSPDLETRNRYRLRRQPQSSPVRSSQAQSGPVKPSQALSG